MRLILVATKDFISDKGSVNVIRTDKEEQITRIATIVGSCAQARDIFYAPKGYFLKHMHMEGDVEVKRFLFYVTDHESLLEDGATMRKINTVISDASWEKIDAKSYYIAIFPSLDEPEFIVKPDFDSTMSKLNEIISDKYELRELRRTLSAYPRQGYVECTSGAFTIHIIPSIDEPSQERLDNLRKTFCET